VATYPYSSAGSGAIVQAVNQLRKAFPTEVSAGTLKKLGIAPNNESYIINILRFVNVIDKEGKRSDAAATAFSKHDDGEFQKAFAGLVKTAYSNLFDLHHDAAWSLSSDSLIAFFRESDHSSAVVGRRQALTFQALAALSGHGELQGAKPTSAVPAKSAKKPKPKAPTKSVKPSAQEVAAPQTLAHGTPEGFGLAVRIEINLPVADDQTVYDRIFKSIRENLLGGK
jgi:hypothetical protein